MVLFNAPIWHCCFVLISDLTAIFNRQKCIDFLDECISIFFDYGYDNNGNDNARQYIVQEICVPLLESCMIPIVEVFFKTHGKKLFELLKKYK